MSSIIDYADAVRTVLQAGETVVEGNVVRVIADNGAEIGNAVVNTVTGGNGTASNVYTMTGEVAGGVAVTSGVGFLALDLGVAGAAIAPCLGVLAGTGLYALAPEFWTNVSNALVSAGKTIGGKILAFTDGNNIGFDNDVIEIFKQALVDINFFVANDQNLPPASFNLNTPIISSAGIVHYSVLRSNRYLDDIFYTCASDVKCGIYKDNDSNTYRVIWAWDSNVTIPCTKHMIITDISTGDVIGDSTSNFPRSVYGNYLHDGKTVYYSVFSTADNEVMQTMYTPSGSASNAHDRNTFGKIAWTLRYGEFQQGNGDNLQDPATTTFPDDDPFPLKYPDWLPWEYPPTAPQGLPDIYPVKAPEVQPTPYPTQDPAQNPTPENDPDFYPWLDPWFTIPDPVVPSPQPQPDPDPDPQPDPDPIDPQPDPHPDPDPVDPNPDPPIPPIPPIPPLPDTVASNKLFTVYNPTDAQLNSLGGYLWDGSLIETLKKIWQNPLDGIISLIKVYATPAVGGAHNIILGYLDSGVSANVVTSQFVTIDCGSVEIKEDKKNATDYSPYTSIHLFLPFIGMVELDVNECMNGSINVIYKVDVYTGTCLAEVKITRAKDMPTATILYEFSGNASQQIPLTSGNATGMLSTLVSGVGAGLSIATGGGLGVVAGATMLGHSLTHEMYHISHSGNLSANAGIMSVRKPFVVIGRRHGYDANNYNTMYGYPANKTVYLGNQEGYTRVKECRLQTSATDPEREQILDLLKSGVII